MEKPPKPKLNVYICFLATSRVRAQSHGKTAESVLYSQCAPSHSTAPKLEIVEEEDHN